MAWRFRKSIGLGKFARINLSRRGIGISAGIPGARVGMGTRGPYTSVGIPGTGLYSINYANSGGQPKAEGGKAANAATVLKGCGILFLLCVGGCFAVAVIGSLGSNKESEHSGQVSTPSTQQAEALPVSQPPPIPAVVLTPGQVYQVSVSVPLLPAMSKLDTVLKNARIIPAYGYFQCIQRETQYAGSWYSAKIFDGAGHCCPNVSRTTAIGYKGRCFHFWSSRLKMPVKWAFSRKARRSKSVELCRG